MSEDATLVGADHFRYVADHTRPEDPFLVALKVAAGEAGIPSIWINWAQASFMQVLLKLMNAREVVEVGTLAGYSAIAMAQALPAGGRVRTIELDDKHADFAEEWFKKSAVADKLVLHRGKGLDVLPDFDDHCADAAFLDADKSNYAAYLEHCMRIVRPGGLIMADNAFAFGELFSPAPDDHDVGAIRAFNDVIAHTDGLHPVIVPLGDGCWVAHKEV